MNINKVTIAGRLTKDPEIRFTSGGMACLKLGTFFAGADRQGDQHAEGVPVLVSMADTGMGYADGFSGIVVNCSRRQETVVIFDVQVVKLAFNILA